MRQLAGRVWVASFIFTRCGGTCPQQTRNVVRLQRRLAASLRYRSVALTTFTVDPDHDTPEVLRSYADQYGADTQRWRFLTGSRDDIWRLSKDEFRLDVRDDALDADMPIFHSTKLVLVDSWARIRGYYEGTTDEGLDELVTDLSTVLRERQRTFMRPDIAEPPWFAERAAAQIAGADDISVFHDFRFRDVLPDTGITHVNRVTPDGAKYYKQVHYDHGDGIAAADVDGDGLTDLLFVSQVGGNELWRSLGGGRFEDVTDRAGVRMREAIGVTASFADVDNDGDSDLYVTTVRSGNRLFLNAGDGTFRDVTETSGLGYSGHSSSAVFFDYDRDGLLDVFLCNVGEYTSLLTAPASESPGDDDLRYNLGHPDAFAGHLKPERNEESLLFRNLGGARFEPVNDSVGLHDMSWTGAATPFDPNRDGWPDLYVVDMQGNDEFYENVGGKRFVDRGRELFPKTPWGAMGVKAFDFDGDGDLDLYVTDMHSDMTEDIGPELEKVKSAAAARVPESLLRTAGASIFGNAFYRNDGPETFTEISDAIGAETYWPWGISVGDLNADGHLDVFVAAGMGYTYRYGINSVLLNEDGERFRDSEFILGVEPRRGRQFAKPWFRLDASGADRDHPFTERYNVTGPHEFWDALNSRGSAILDLDEDGDLDIVTVDFGSEPQILISDLAERRPAFRFLKVRLIGSRSNRDGFGATVRVRVGGRTLTQVHDGQSGYLAQSVLPLYFGLGTAGDLESVDVEWPSGTRQTVRDKLSPNETLVVREPE